MSEEAKRCGSRCVYDGRIVRVDLDDVLLPNGVRTELEMIRHRGAAAIVPLDEDGSVHLVRQYRWATRGRLLEVPAGTLESDESPESCAMRETVEEVGRRPGRLEPLGAIWSTPGFTDERIWLFLARELAPAPGMLDEDEAIEPVRLPFTEAVAMAERGGIEDGKSICALLRAAVHLRERGQWPARVR
jgi:ADP-ribose pyrophosphatase